MKISKHGLSGILGLLCVEQDVGNLKKIDFQELWVPVRRTRRRKSQKLQFLEVPTDVVAAAQLRRHQAINVQQMMVAVLRARRLEAGINGPGDAEMTDRGSDFGVKRGTRITKMVVPPILNICVWNHSIMVWTLVPPSQAMGSKVGYGFLCAQGCSPRTAVKSE